MIMALRYALGRRTYVTSEVPDFIQENERAVLDKSNFIIQNEEEMNPRVCSVMLKDLKEYISDRNKGLIQDDECDYKSWLNLYQWLIALDTRQGWGVYKNER